MLYAARYILLLLVSSAAAFAPVGAASRSTRAAVRMSDDVDLNNPFLKAVNGLQEAFQNSPAAQFKQGLAKMQAGDYDEVAVKAKLDGLIGEPAVMFSFTT